VHPAPPAPATPGLIPPSYTTPWDAAEDVDLLKALKVLVGRQPYGRVAHGYCVIQRYGQPIRSAVQIGAFLTWMEAEGLSASTRRSIVGLLRRVQPHNVAL